MSDKGRSERHLPVMGEDAVEILAVKPGGLYVDATLGDGGYSEQLLERSRPDGFVLAIDQDDGALTRSRSFLSGFGSRITMLQARFGGMREVLEERGWLGEVDGMVLDLGVSTYQLETASRGFSFLADGPLDMRMDRTRPDTAADLCNSLPEAELAGIIRRYGEEPRAKRVARQIAARRQEAPLKTTADLREAVLAAGVKGRPGHNPATRTFQALRIAVNEELGELERFLDRGWEYLAPGGRMAIISYHSLEDRIVKRAFRMWASECICPPGLPQCVCGWEAKVDLLTRRIRRPSPAEVERNPRARSAGLRAVQRKSAAGEEN